MLLVLLGTLAVFLLLCFISYSPMDSAFTQVSDRDVVDNWMGLFGAYLADVFLFSLGLAAYLLPFWIVHAGFSALRTKTGDKQPLWLLIRGSGWLSVLLGLCVLLSLHSDPVLTLPAGPGGIVGMWLATPGSNLLGWIGLSVVALAGVLLGFQAAVGFSWLDIAEMIGRGLTRGTQITAQFIRSNFDRWRDRRSVRRQLQEQTESRKQKRAERMQHIGGFEEGGEGRGSKVEIVRAAKPEKAIRRSQQKRLFEPQGLQELPDIDLLDHEQPGTDKGYSADSLEALSRLLELKLADFGVEAEVVSVMPGPVVTRFEVQPSAGTKVQKITALAKDLARSLAVISVRIVEVIPGKSVVGIEIPNESRAVVQLKEVIDSNVFQESPSRLTLALGKDIGGESVVADVARMPHLLVAGTTGSGKSVGVNAMLLSLLFKSTPDEVRLILVDPKMLELSVYEGIPHLLTPVVTDMKEAAHALNWCVAEMERRYRLMAAQGVRNLAGFNRQVTEAIAKGEPLLDPLWNVEGEAAPELKTLPAIVVVIDEFADMMMIVGKKVEQLIARIAQKARAAGIHLILATQRPSVDVITGLIKANIPARMSYQVSSRVDSRTILDQGGAEQLLGHGDMLYLPPGTALPQRVHGAFVSDEEVARIVEDWRRRGAPDYLEEIVTGGSDADAFMPVESGQDSEQEDELYDEAVSFVLESRRASISAVQRKLRIGYNRAARLIEAMEAAGVVTPMNTNGSREIIVPKRD